MKWFIIVIALFSLANGIFMTSYAQDEAQLFVVDGGDGDQSFFGQPQLLHYIQPIWFDGKITRDKTFVENAYLLEVISEGEFQNRYVAITSRLVMSIEEQFLEREGASIIIHLVDHDFVSGEISDLNSLAIGMTYIERVNADN